MESSKPPLALPGLFVLTAAAVGAIACLWSRMESQEQLLQGLSANVDRLLTKSVDATQAAAVQLDRRLLAFERRQDGQDRLLHDVSTSLDRLLAKTGDVSQATAAEIERRLSALERRLGDAEAWPRDEAESNAFNKELIACMDLIPPTAEEAWIPRLTPLRWGAEVFHVLKCRLPCHTDEDGADLLNDARTLRASKPRKGSEALLKTLAAAIETLDRELAATSKRKTLALAEEALRGGDLRLIAMASQTLAGAAEEPLLELRKKLEARRQMLQADEKLAELRRVLDRTAKIDDDMLRMANLARIQDAASGVLLDFELEDPRPEAAIVAGKAILVGIQQQKGQLLERARGAQARRQANYQAWALDSILRYNERYKAALNFPDNSSSEGKWKQVMFAMTTYLLPIDPNLLDEAVGPKYHNAYDAGWKKLEGRDDQTYVAQQRLVVKRKTLEDVR